MPKQDDEKFNFIPVDEEIAEWRKDPEYMREYERQKPEFDRLRRRIDARIARRERWKAVVAWLRGVWAYLTRGIDGRVF